ncbi:MAG: HAD hydrolase family protein [Nitrososphaerota archaeon]|nr:HAD hydrolase family protein [Nitrososphaerota archaeon]
MSDTKRVGAIKWDTMGFRALALDFDGTAITDGEPLNSDLAERIAKLRAIGVKVILATGRSVSELQELVDLGMFDAVVAENGTILVISGTKSTLAPKRWLRERKKFVKVLGQGFEEVLISLGRERLDEARSLVGGRAKIELNKDRIMVGPTGFDKGSGLKEALRRLGIGDGVVCIGDGENDLPMFRVSNVRIALLNSVEALKSEADYIASRPDGEGAAEAIGELMLK